MTTIHTVFQPSLLASLLRSQRNLDHIISLNNILSVVHLIITNLISVAVIMPIVLPVSTFDTNVGMISIATFFAFTAVAMLFFGLQAAYIQKKVVHVLSESYAISKDARTQQIRQKIEAHQKHTFKQGILQFVIYGVFAYVSVSFEPT